MTARLRQRFLVTAVALGIALGCTRPEPPPIASGFAGWLKGTTDQKFDVITNHLRGFDMAMVETGYRYTALYLAGEDRNFTNVVTPTVRFTPIGRAAAPPGGQIP